MLILLLAVTINVNVNMKNVQAGEDENYDWGYSDNSDGTITITRYYGSNSYIDIPSEISGKKVTKIGEYVFSNTNLKKITMPDTITEIGYGAFESSNLCEINLSKNLTKICCKAFSYTQNLSAILIPDSVTEIEEVAFTGDDNITIYCGDNSYAKSYAQSNNLNCKSKEEYDNGVRNGFYTTIENDKVSILGLAENIDNVVIPKEMDGKEVTKINSWAFTNSNIKEITIPDSVTEIGHDCFSGCRSLGKVSLSNNLQSIPYNCFPGCTNLYSIDIPESVIEIGDNAFSEGSLKQINLPSNLKKIDYGAFSFSYTLLSIKIPDSVTEIGSNVFEGNDDTILYCDNNSYAKSYAESNNIKCKGIEEYESGISDGLFYTVHDNEVIITGQADDNSKVVIPQEINGKKVTSICKFAFYNDANIVSIEVNASLKEIEQYAFSTCSKLQQFNMNNEVEKLNQDIFSNCTQLKSVNFKGNISIIPSGMFFLCENLDINSILYNNHIKEIGASAFEYCKQDIDENALKDVEIIDEYAFAFNDKINKLNLENVSSIGEYAFWNCPNCVLVSDAGSVVEKYAKDNNIKFEAKIPELAIKNYIIKKVSPNVKLSKLKLAVDAEGSSNLKYRFVVLKDGKNIYTRGYNSHNYTTWKPTEKGEYTICFKVKDDSNKEVSKTINYTVK